MTGNGQRAKLAQTGCHSYVDRGLLNLRSDIPGGDVVGLSSRPSPSSALRVLVEKHRSSVLDGWSRPPDFLHPRHRQLSPSPLNQGHPNNETRPQSRNARASNPARRFRNSRRREVKNQREPNTYVARGREDQGHGHGAALLYLRRPMQSNTL